MIDTKTDIPLSRKEKYLFDLINKFDVEPITVFGETQMSTPTPSPDNPATFTDVIYTQTATARGAVLRGFGNKKDKLFIDPANREAYIERNIGVIQFDGTENWQEYFPQVDPPHGFSCAIDLADGINGGHTSICSHFGYVYNAWSSEYSAETGIYTDHPWNTTRYFRPPYEGYNTVEKFKAWLAEMHEAGTPVTVYYYLAQTQREEIPYVGG